MVNSMSSYISLSQQAVASHLVSLDGSSVVVKLRLSKFSFGRRGYVSEVKIRD